MLCEHLEIVAMGIEMEFVAAIVTDKGEDCWVVLLPTGDILRFYPEHLLEFSYERCENDIYYNAKLLTVA